MELGALRHKFVVLYYAHRMVPVADSSPSMSWAIVVEKLLPFALTVQLWT